MVNSVQEIRKIILPILIKNNVIKAGIFGSYVRGEQKKNSDVDLLVELEKDIDLLDVIRIKIELEKVLKKKVDLVEYETIRSELKNPILKEEVLIYEKE
ncbi:nucleotidyltransferase domain-containing protein [Candidatus Pacearchaeota archaeon]|nr:nucleotidyltransferase domain-containing protein [Candidatus Pacearchaeota archaeon]